VIRVQEQPAPAEFISQVRTPGRRFLRQHRRPTRKQWESHAYWRRILENLHDAYRGICAYSCHWIPYDTGADTVEHFQPKSAHPNRAYDWSNYRLVCSTLNGRKQTDENVLDPFAITNGWFVLEFPSLLIKPATGLPAVRRAEVLHTRDTLGLNDEGTCLKARARYVKNYCLGNITFAFLREEAPFIAMEITRQRLVNRLNDVMGY
jgi:hypothetical protein